LSIQQIKETLREHNIKFHDCFERQDFEEKLKLVQNLNLGNINYLDPNSGGKRRIKEIYYDKIRDSKRVTITKEELCEKQWYAEFHNNKWFPEFKENGVLYISKGYEFMNYQIKNKGRSIKVENYPDLVVSRTPDWGFILENSYFVMKSIDTKKRINSQTEFTVKYRIQVATKVKEEANELFKNKEYENAIQLYKTVFTYVKGLGHYTLPEFLANRYKFSSDKSDIFDLINLKISTLLNLSTTFEVLKLYNDSIASATKALRIDKNSIKAKYRRGIAFLHSLDYERAVLDLTQAYDSSKDSNILKNLNIAKNLLVKKNERVLNSI